jgi:hypothetical protein
MASSSSDSSNLSIESEASL